MDKKILLVDDDPAFLESFQGRLRKEYHIDTAQSGEEALKKIGLNGGYAVTICDLKMPGMDGVEVLSTAKDMASDSVRILLTGNATLETAIEAVNRGNIFRLLVKPCSMDILREAIKDALRQYQLIEGEKEMIREDYNKKILKALKETIQGIAMTVETKDPYTAGHQKRVSRIASAVVQEMGFPHEQIEGLEMAGLIHDIGKIYVPAEILNRPGRLSNEEFNMVKSHVKIGYNIVKNINFPWPIATIILQHHERMNGSGYPAGISGDEIILESRIMAVADVLEAMATHRPYRPAFLLEKAIGEICEYKGILYDEDVVNICKKLFEEKRFPIEV
jgi:putative two-component system response regulator